MSSFSASTIPTQLKNFFNGTFFESFDARVTSAGGVVTMSLEKSGGGDLTMWFSDGKQVLDCSPACTVTLTAGDDDAPTPNYVYIPKSTKALTVSTSDWPVGTEHIKVGYFLVPSATYIATDGVYINQNWNDHSGLTTDGQGHEPNIGERIRREGARYFSGVNPNGEDQDTNSSYFDYVAADESYFKSASGVIWQMHRHAFPAKDTRVASGDMHVVNWYQDAYHDINAFNEIVADSQNASLGNRYFNLIIFGVGNKGGEYGPMMVNLPTGSYSNQTGAEQDVSGFDTLGMPRQFTLDSSTGFLVCRLTLKYSGGTGTLEHVSTVDLRGTRPSAVTGGVSGITTDFADNQFNVFNVTDSTKILAFSISDVTTGNTRTLTVPDVDTKMWADNGSIPLTDNWDVGNFTITANGLTIDGTFTDGTMSITGGALSAVTTINTTSHITVAENGGIAVGGTAVADTILIETSDTDDPTAIFKTTNTAHQINIILDESATNDRFCIQGQTAAVDTHLCLHAQDGEAMKVQLYSGATNRTDLIMGAADNFSIQNFVEDKNIAFTVNDGGVTKTITWVAATNTLTFNDDTILDAGAGNIGTTGTITGINVSSGADPGHTHTAYEAAGTMTTHESTYNHPNYDTAYGWGDHGVAGYAPTASPTFTGAVTIPSTADDGTYTGIVTNDGGVLKYRTKQQLSDDLEATIDHDNLFNYDANDHIDHTGVTISGAANDGIDGGGTIAASRTLSLDIDGMTDIGAALVDADLMIVDDGADGTNRKSAMSRVATYIWAEQGCRIKTGTYTGDGTEGQAITGVGFLPKFVEIQRHPAAEQSYTTHWKFDQTWGDYAMQEYSVGTEAKLSMINSLDADGFTVDDRASNFDPNVNGQVYDYICWG